MAQMTLAELAEQIRSFEVLPPQELSEGKPIVARLIGRRFEQLLDGQFEKPFDTRFGKMMLKTLSHLCATLGASYGYAERTELSLYAVSHGGEARRLLSRICGEAAAKLSLLLGQVATFEARLYEFESVDAACEYFQWRFQETQLHALDSYCGNVLTVNGADPVTIPAILEGLGHDEKLELLRQNAIDFNLVPLWQKRGAGVYLVGDSNGRGARLVVDLQLPAPDEYSQFLKRFVS
jgi:tRNA(His) 5'-end guanylyltransferase